MKSILKRSAAVLLCAALVLCAFSFYGCGKKETGLKFQNQALAGVLAQVFSKEVNQLTEEDLASIESVSMLTYSQSNTMSFILKGYDTASSDEEKAKLSATADITGLDLSDMSDFRYLTGLKGFEGWYIGYSNFDFLKSCTALETFSLNGNAECHDFSFLSAFPMLTTLSLSECMADNMDFLKGHENKLQALYLRSFRVGDDVPYDLEFIRPFSELTTLCISGHWIEDLSPLTGLKKLTYLDLSYGSIEDVSPLAEMPQLTYIDLTQNIVRDVSSLTTFDPDKFERIILDLNSGISDWSPLEYLGQKVQGKPTARDLEEMQRQNEADSNSDGESEPKADDNAAILPVTDDENLQDGYGDNDIDISDFDF